MDASVKLFNQSGVVNVRLQHIADEAFVSLGNLTYHFNNKESIITTIWANLKAQQRQLINEFRVLPLFEDIDLYLSATYTLQARYIFFYTDTLEIVRAFPAIAAAYQEQITWQEQQIYFMINFNASRGAFRQEPLAGLYQASAKQFCRLVESYVHQHKINHTHPIDFESFRKDIWDYLLLLCSPVGMTEYHQLYARNSAQR